jgi:hypothetical protein
VFSGGHITLAGGDQFVWYLHIDIKYQDINDKIFSKRMCVTLVWQGGSIRESWNYFEVNSI